MKMRWKKEEEERNSAMCDTEYLYFSFDRKQKKTIASCG